MHCHTLQQISHESEVMYMCYIMFKWQKVVFIQASTTYIYFTIIVLLEFWPKPSQNWIICRYTPFTLILQVWGLDLVESVLCLIFSELPSCQGGQNARSNHTAWAPSALWHKKKSLHFQKALRCIPASRKDWKLTSWDFCCFLFVQKYI